MRVVEYSKDTTSTPYQWVRGLGIGAAILAVVVCALLIANNLSLKRADPVHSPALKALLAELKSNPTDQAIKEEIRELDYLARRAFFTSQRFNRLGIYVLVGSLVVMVVAFKTLSAYQSRLPYPDSSDPKEDVQANALWARKSVTAAGLILVGFALVLALPWKSRLDDLEPVLADSGTVASSGADAGELAVTTVTTARVGVPTREELLRNWPMFRGPAAGIAQASNAPVEWNGESEQGVAWKTAVPKPGFSSPVVWEGRLFLSGADSATREVYCFGTDQGELLWQHEVIGIPGSPPTAPEVSEDTGYAACTMATDGARVFVIFSNGDLVALDLEGGAVWSRNLGVPDNPYGHASSLVVSDGLLLVQYDQKNQGAFLGIDVATGETRWKAVRAFGPSWATPTLVERGDHVEAVLATGKMIVSYEPATGKKLWEAEFLKGGDVGATPVYADGLFYVSADYAKIAAIDARTLTIAWESEDAIPSVSTPIVAGGLLFGGLSDGGIVCYDAGTGEEVWLEETDYGFYASPILVGDKVYLLDRSGMMHIFAASREFTSLGKPELGEEAVCTPAVVGGSLYCRGAKHLFKLGT